MDRLSTWRFAVAAAVTVAALNVVCALFVVAAPEATVAFFGTWLHGLDLKRLVPAVGKPITAGAVGLGALNAAIVSFVGGAILAGCYNRLLPGRHVEPHSGK